MRLRCSFPRGYRADLGTRSQAPRPALGKEKSPDSYRRSARRLNLPPTYSQRGVAKQDAVNVTIHVVPSINGQLVSQATVELDHRCESDVLDVPVCRGPSGDHATLPLPRGQPVRPFHSSEVSVLEH